GLRHDGRQPACWRAAQAMPGSFETVRVDLLPVCLDLLPCGCWHLFCWSLTARRVVSWMPVVVRGDQARRVLWPGRPAWCLAPWYLHARTRPVLSLVFAGWQAG